MNQADRVGNPTPTVFLSYFAGGATSPHVTNAGQTSWDQFVAFVRELVASSSCPSWTGDDVTDRQSKKRLPLVSPADFRHSYRKKENVQRLGFGALDIDALPGDGIDALLKAVCQYRAIIYTTPSDGHKPGGVRCLRVFVAVDRPIMPDESERFRDGLAALLGVVGDRQSRSADKGFFCGRYAGDSDRAFAAKDGAIVSVDQCLLLATGYTPPAQQVAGELGSLITGTRMLGASRSCPVGTSPGDYARRLCNEHTPAVEGNAGHSVLFNLACDLVVGLELDASEAEELAWEHFNPRCEPPWSESQRGDFARKFTEASDKSQRAPGYLLQSEAGAQSGESKARPCVLTCVNAFTEAPSAWQLAYDELARQTVLLAAPPAVEGIAADAGAWTDHHSRLAGLWLHRARGIVARGEHVNDAVHLVARRRSFHPVRDYLASLRWDGVPRVGRWLVNYCGAEHSAYVNAVGQCWLVSAVARALDPGCKVDHMLILQGAQGLGKSTLLRALASDAWFHDTGLDFNSKDCMQDLAGRWIIELGELDSLNRSEVTTVKAFLSSVCDNYRPSYGRTTEAFPRTCVFAGTTNSDKFLKDTTGNRRFWPVECSRADWRAVQNDRDQLWAEAVALYRRGAPWWLSGDLEQLAAEQQAAHLQDDPWLTALEQWTSRVDIEPPRVGQLGQPIAAQQVPGLRTDFTLAEALQGALGIDIGRQSRSDATRAGGLLQQLGYRPQQVTRQGQRPRVYRHMPYVAAQPAQPSLTSGM